MTRQVSLNVAHPTDAHPIDELFDENYAQRKNGQNVLHFACQQHQSLRTVRQIVCSVPDAVEQLDYDLNTPLHVAAENGSSKEALDLLISEYPKGLSIQNSHGKNPLHIFCEKSLKIYRNPLSIVKKMVEAFPDSLKQVDNQSRTPLHFAMYEASFEVIDYLVTKFAHAASKQDNEGRTPVHTMCCNGLFLINENDGFYDDWSSKYVGSMRRIEILLSILTSAPVALIKKDAFGKIPLDYAIEYGANEEIVTKLQQGTEVVWKIMGEAYFKRRKRRTAAFVRRLCDVHTPCDNTCSTEFDDDDSVAQYKGDIPACIFVRDI